MYKLKDLAELKALTDRALALAERIELDSVAHLLTLASLELQGLILGDDIEIVDHSGEEPDETP